MAQPVEIEVLSKMSFDQGRDESLRRIANAEDGRAPKIAVAQ